MKLAQELVKQFMLRAGQECPLKPEIPDFDTCVLRIELIAEEWQELQDALGLSLAQDTGEFTEAEPNLVKVADAIGDLLVVVLGTAVACGIDIEPIFSEIHRSNMTKFIDGHKREGGKWIKGPSYSCANLEPLIAEQQL